MKASSLALLALGVNAEYDACQQPTLEWAGIDQGNGRSYAYAVAATGGKIFAAGYASGNLTFASVHASNPASGEVNDHTKVGVDHATGSYAGGRYTKAANSQHGMDAIVYKMSEAGVPESVYAIDTVPADGKIADSINGNYGGYSYIYGLEPFQSDTTHLAVVGSFRGNVTFPMASGADITLTNWKSGDYDGFVSKLDHVQQKAVWTTGLHTPKGRNYARATATTAAGHVIVSGDQRPSKSYEGHVTKINGVTGAVVWQKIFKSFYYLYGAAAFGEDIFVAGRIKGKDVDPIGAGIVNSSKSGTKESAAIVKLNADGTGAWQTLLGEGRGYDVFASSDGLHVYATGTLSSADVWTGTGACSLDVTAPMVLKGFVVKLSASTGACVWAKPTGGGRKIVADTAAAYMMMYEDDPVQLDATHVVQPRGKEADTLVVKFNAADGAGLWGASIGGTGDDYAYDMAMTPSGPVIAGRTQSDSFAVGSSSIKNLQHARAEAAPGASDKVNSGERAIFVVKMTPNGAQPSCLSSCSDAAGGTANAAVKGGNCFVDNMCLADGEFSSTKSCFKCMPSKSQKKLDGPITTNHCYFGDTCYTKGTMAPAYMRYNQASVCEWCDPAVSTTGWSVKTGFLHDREYASKIEGGRGASGKKNSFGVTFSSGSNGCQMLPSVALPTTKSSKLVAAANAAVAAKSVKSASSIAAAKTAFTGSSMASNPIASLVIAALDGTGSFASPSDTARRAAAHTMVTDTIPAAAVSSSLAAGDWKSAYTYYSGDASTCTKVGDVCANTPAATADTFGALFGTTLHYGHSISRVKTQQALSIGESSSTEASLKPALLEDAKSHIQITYYQAVMAKAYEMDTGTKEAKATAQAEAFAYWKIIEPSLLELAPAEAKYVGKMFDPASATTSTRRQLAITGDYHYCAAKALLEGNLPNSSFLEYTMGATASSVELGSKQIHVTINDLGSLTAASSVTCTAPPPSPPSPPPLPPSPKPPSPSNPPPSPSVPDTSSALTTGQTAGIGVGAAVAALIFLALAIYCVVQKRAQKPVFTCLDDGKSPVANVKKDPKAVSATSSTPAA